MPRVLHLSTARTWRGGEAQAFHVIADLARRAPGEVALAAPAGGELARRATALGDGCRLFDLPGRGGLSVRSLLAVQRAVRAFRPALIHTHTSNAHELAWLAGSRRVPIVATRRVDFAIPASGTRVWKYRARRVWNVAISNAIAGILRGAGIPEARVAFIPSGIDTSRFAEVDGTEARAAARHAVRAELGLTEKIVAVGNIAALTDHKGQVNLVEAAGELARRFRTSTDPRFLDRDAWPCVGVLIAGEGEERRALEAAIRRLKLARADGGPVYVDLLGERGDVPRLLSAFDVFAMPSKMEGLGTAILDALWMELPVVATRVGGIPDIIRDGENGLLVVAGEVLPLAEALEDLATDEALRGKLGARARASVAASPFLAETMVASYLELYERVLSEWGSRVR